MTERAEVENRIRAHNFQNAGVLVCAHSIISSYGPDIHKTKISECDCEVALVYHLLMQALDLH